MRGFLRRMRGSGTKRYRRFRATDVKPMDVSPLLAEPVLQLVLILLTCT